jgi:transmembrane sensor
MIASLFRRRRGRTAAEWFAMRLAGTDAKLDREFDAWLAEDPARREEYALCEITWEVSQEAAREIPPPRYRARRVDAGPVGRRAAVFAIAAAALVAIVWFWPPATLSFATAAGEQRTLVLEDGSRVTLNTRTRIGVRFGRHTREIVLDGGEAFFEVSHDASRPFIVRTSIGSARAVGTRFDVYLEERQLSVTTADGSVLVDGPISGNGVVVGAGNRTELRPGAARAVVEPADLTAALGWLSRRLEANNAMLADVLRDFSRYTTLPIRAATPAIAQLRVSAVLRTGDLEALQATLKDAFGLEIERRDGEYLVFDRRDREANAPQ